MLFRSIRFALFFLAEFMNTMTMSAIIVTLFLGGPQPISVGHWTLDIPLGPFTGTFWFLLKVVVFLYIYIWFRATLPRLRYDQLMDLGWKWLIELAFLWIMVSGVIIIARDQGWNLFLIVPAAVVGAVAVLGLLRLSMPKRSEFVEEIR